MGVAVSDWRLARAVSVTGQLGVVSGTAVAVVLARRLQMGDLDGSMRHALKHFPIQEMAERIIADHYIEGGKAPDKPFKLTAMPTLNPPRKLVELTVLSNFVEVFLAKEGHQGAVGINFLEKIQLPTLPSIFGAMLAGVDYVLIGAGIPRSIPGVLDRLSEGLPVELQVHVEGALSGEQTFSTFDPVEFWGGKPPALPRPKMLGIVASTTLAMTLARKSNGRIDGFVVEGETAGGHNAPPRGQLALDAGGEPVYGPRDTPDLKKIAELGLPFWLAGSYGRPGMLEKALELGATGVQIGTAFAFCEESGIANDLKFKVLQMAREGKVEVFTDPVASPTGFPFKVVQVPKTMSEEGDYMARQRICDLGYLRHMYRKPDASIGYRCPAEPVADFEKKGGTAEETKGRKCVCNGLPGTIGMPQVRPGGIDELPLITSGNDLVRIAQFLAPGRDSYSAADVIEAALGSLAATAATAAE